MSVKKLIRNHLLPNFIIYISLNLSFALIYFTAYKINPNNFLFNDDIKNSQIISYTLYRQHSIKEAQEQVRILQPLLQKLDTITNDNIAEENPLIVKIGGYTYTFSENFFGKSGNISYLSVYNTNSYQEITKILFKQTRYNSSGSKDNETRLVQYKQIVSSQLRNNVESIIRSTKELETLETDNPDVWSFYDFVYFSSLTHSTVGFGDIIPNSTTTRNIVTIQTHLVHPLVTSILIIFISQIAKITPKDP